MNARDVMTTNVATVGLDSSVRQVAEIMVKRGVSALPVVDAGGKLVGIVSEGDLMHRAETETRSPRSWWLKLIGNEDALAAAFVKAHARKVKDVMTKDVISVAPDTPVSEIAALLERKGIKRVPIVDKNGQLVGIVSRANLVQALAAFHQRPRLEVTPTDAAIRDRLMAQLKNEPWADTSLINVVVNDGVVDLWGLVRSTTQKNAIRVAAESTPGVRAVRDNLRAQPVESWA